MRKKAIIISAVVICALVFIYAAIIVAIDFADVPFTSTHQSLSKEVFNSEEYFEFSETDTVAHPYSIHLLINGEIYGKAIVRLGSTDSTFSWSDTISKKVNLAIDRDWYENKVVVTYIPLTSTIGTLNIDCDIFSFK